MAEGVSPKTRPTDPEDEFQIQEIAAKLWSFQVRWMEALLEQLIGWRNGYVNQLTNGTRRMIFHIYELE